jgi:hypothetical protein
MAPRRTKVGVTFVSDESIEEALRRLVECPKLALRGLIRRDRLRLKLTRRQHTILQTPCYLR